MMDIHEYDQKGAFRNTAIAVCKRIKATSVFQAVSEMARGKYVSAGFEDVGENGFIADEHYEPTLDGVMDFIEQSDTAETAVMMHHLIMQALDFYRFIEIQRMIIDSLRDDTGPDTPGAQPD